MGLRSIRCLSVRGSPRRGSAVVRSHPLPTSLGAPPRLTLTSPEKRCGKSRLMDIARGDLLPAARHGQREHGRCGPLNHRRPADLNG
jgi:hypothetical protein